MIIKLVNPSYEKALDDKLDPPFGLMYIAAVLEKAGYPVEIVDLCFVPHNKWREAIGKADVVGITVMSATLHIATEILHLAKHNNPQAIVVAGGAHASGRPYETLSEGFDAVIAGEGEYTFLNLVKQIAEGKDFEKVTISPQVDVNTLPFPARHLVNLKAYTRKIAGESATTIITSRGCPYHCAFCEKSVHGEGVRFRSIQSIIEEIEEVIGHYGIRNFKFEDDTFTLNRNRLYKLLDELKKLDIRFRCQGNARTDTYDDFVRLYEAGCRQIIFGVESGSQHILDLVNKGVTVEQNQRAIINAKKAGLVVRANLMVGSPGETWETVEETIDFMWQTQPQQWIVTNFLPLPGCAIGKNPAKYGIKILVNDWKQYFLVAGQNVGGLTHRTEHMSMEDIGKARKHLLESLPPQTGSLEDYYIELAHK
jgi:radical SAM superfamily enzyme YgiQ (UPF0313 family)